MLMELIMKKLPLFLLVLSFAGCTGMGNQSTTSNADKANPQDMTYRGGPQ